MSILEFSLLFAFQPDDTGNEILDHISFWTWLFYVFTILLFFRVISLGCLALYCRSDVPLQKQVESSSANQELVHPQRKPIDRSRSHNVARFKVLADVDGNSPRAPANHDKVQLEGVCPPGTPDIIPFSRLRRTASGV